MSGMKQVVTAPVAKKLTTGNSMDNTIRFISNRDYSWMSNFHHAPFTFNGLLWPTVEHAFQAAKNCYLDPSCTEIREAKTPGEAKRLGRNVALRPDWEEVKLAFMANIVLAKFCAHPDLALKLSDTGDVPIEEDAKWDSYWGTGKRGPGGVGDNNMGKILVSTRDIFQRDMPDLRDVVRKRTLKLV